MTLSDDGRSVSFMCYNGAASQTAGAGSRECRRERGVCATRSLEPVRAAGTISYTLAAHTGRSVSRSGTHGSATTAHARRAGSAHYRCRYTSCVVRAPHPTTHPPTHRPSAVPGLVTVRVNADKTIAHATDSAAYTGNTVNVVPRGAVSASAGAGATGAGPGGWWISGVASTCGSASGVRYVTTGPTSTAIVGATTGQVGCVSSSAQGPTGVAVYNGQLYASFTGATQGIYMLGGGAP